MYVQNGLISVIIPVHNGENYINRIAGSILKQSYKNLELVLIENQSSDLSYEICKRIAKEDHRVKAVKTEEKGTSLARKKGIELASGDYIVFCDQDDRFISTRAIESMFQAITADKADICVFGYYKEFLKIIKKRVQKQNCVLSGAEIRKNEIKGTMGVKSELLDQPVWNKVYRASVLKSITHKITKPLFFAEDEYLNMLAFSSENTSIVSFRNEAYYVWSAGTGYSSSGDSNRRLMQDYETVKPTAIEIIEEYAENPEAILWHIHTESLYSMKVSICRLIQEGNEKERISERITEYNSMNYIQEAKAFFRTFPDQTAIWEDLRFLSGSYSADEYIRCCQEHLKNQQKECVKTLLYKGLKLIQ